MVLDVIDVTNETSPGLRCEGPCVWAIHESSLHCPTLTGTTVRDLTYIINVPKSFLTISSI